LSRYRRIRFLLLDRYEKVCCGRTGSWVWAVRFNECAAVPARFTRFTGGRRWIGAVAVRLVAFAAALFLPGVAAAMEFSIALGPSGRILIHATGAITTGDAGRLRYVLYEAGNKQPHLVINSGGGLASEGIRIARMVATERIPVTAGEVCASACFLVLAASPDRSAGPSSRVGVHRAYSRSAGETAGSLDATMDLARFAASLGVPAPILARMATTPGNENSIAWLTADELRSMDVRPMQAAAGARQPATPVAAAAAQPPRVVDPPGAARNTADAGRADRATYRRWLAGLSDSGREGAAFWTKQRLLPRPGNCLRGGDAAFSLACFEAQRLWAMVDERSRDPEYRRGWDGY
jgi:hypothetical protein